MDDKEERKKYMIGAIFILICGIILRLINAGKALNFIAYVMIVCSGLTLIIFTYGIIKEYYSQKAADELSEFIDIFADAMREEWDKKAKIEKNVIQTKILEEPADEDEEEYDDNEYDENYDTEIGENLFDDFEEEYLDNKKALPDINAEREELLEQLELDFENASFEKAKSDIEYAKTHSKFSFPEYVRLYKETADARYARQIGDVLTIMCCHNNKVLIRIINNVPVLIELNGKFYLSIYTQSKFIPPAFKESTQGIYIREAFNLFYALYEKGVLSGIIFNFGGDGEIVFSKESIDLLQLELLFDLPYKTKN